MNGDASTHRRNRGAVMLARIGETQAKIAKRLKITREEVAYFESGARKPGKVNRAQLQAEYKIPATAWDEDPVPPTFSTLAIDDSVAGHVGRLQKSITQLHETALTDETLAHRERMNLIVSAIAATERLAKLTEGASISQTKLLRMPAMRRLIEQISKALEPWPDAMRAVGEALRKSDNDDIDQETDRAV